MIFELSAPKAPPDLLENQTPTKSSLHVGPPFLFKLLSDPYSTTASFTCTLLLSGVSADESPTRIPNSPASTFQCLLATS